MTTSPSEKPEMSQLGASPHDLASGLTGMKAKPASKACGAGPRAKSMKSLLGRIGRLQRDLRKRGVFWLASVGAVQIRERAEVGRDQLFDARYLEGQLLHMYDAGVDDVEVRSEVRYENEIARMAVLADSFRRGFRAVERTKAGQKWRNEHVEWVGKNRLIPLGKRGSGAHDD